MPPTSASRRADSQQLVRQWALLRLLSTSGRAWAVKELSEQLGVSKATVQRDLATMERDFALVEEEAGRQKKVYRIDQSVRALEGITFGTTELLALHAAQAALAGLVGTPLHDDLEAVRLKIRGFLSPRHNGGLDAIARVFASHVRGHVDYEPQRELIDGLADAIARRRRCELTYHAAWNGTTRTHEARPLRLVWHRSALYLFACLGAHQRITTLSIGSASSPSAPRPSLRPRWTSRRTSAEPSGSSSATLRKKSRSCSTRRSRGVSRNARIILTSARNGWSTGACATMSVRARSGRSSPGCRPSDRSPSWLHPRAGASR